jgi:hypothetical protein
MGSDSFVYVVEWVESGGSSRRPLATKRATILRNLSAPSAFGNLSVTSNKAPAVFMTSITAVLPCELNRTAISGLSVRLSKAIIVSFYHRARCCQDYAQ